MSAARAAEKTEVFKNFGFLWVKGLLIAEFWDFEISFGVAC